MLRISCGWEQWEVLGPWDHIFSISVTLSIKCMINKLGGLDDFSFPFLCEFQWLHPTLSPTTFHGQLLPGGREQTHLLTIHDDWLNGAQVCCIGLRPLLHEASWIASSTGLPAFPHAPFSVCLFISSFRLQCHNHACGQWLQPWN